MELTATMPQIAAQGTESRPIRVTETYWGYVIHDDRQRLSRESLGTSALRFGGLILILTAYGQWLLPGALYAGDATVAKAVLSFFLGAIGAAVYWFASGGSDTDLHVDLTRREIRVARRNARDQARLQAVLPMANIAGTFIARPRDGDGPAQLFLRLRDREAVVHVADGDEDDLLILHRRLAHDLRPLEERIDLRLARALPFRSVRAS